MSNRIVQLTDAAGNNAYPITYANNILDSSGSPIGGFATDEMISDQYDSTREGYSEGDYCIYQDTLYRCIRSTPALPSGVGEFNSAYWEAIRLADAVASNKSAITSEIESDQYYDKNEYAFHNDDLYKCTSDDTLGWNNGSGWSSTTVGDELTSLKSDLTTFQGKFIFRYTLGIDVITTANSLPNDSITFYANSNVPTNCPSQVGYGSYIFLKTNNTTSIICFDKSHLAHTQGVTSSTTSISWHTI